MDTDVIGQAPPAHKSRTRFVLVGGRRRVCASGGMAAAQQQKCRGGGRSSNLTRPIRVDTARVQRRDVPIYLEGLGTVQAFYTVTITARVDGQIEKVGFTEGQTIEKGALIAQIDPRPYQAALDQALAMKAKDASDSCKAPRRIWSAISSLRRRTSPASRPSMRNALWLQASMRRSRAIRRPSKTRAPSSITRRSPRPSKARTGIRLVDPGNIVHAADTTGIVVLTQVQPISFIFTLPEDELPAVSARWPQARLP